MMLRVADLTKGVALLVGFERNVEIDGGASGWVAQKPPVDRNGMPGVLDQQVAVIPRYDGRREAGKGHNGEKGENRLSVV